VSETEVESLVVRLTGDGSDYAQMLKDARVQTLEAAAQVQVAAGRIEQFSGSLKGFASGALSALGAFGAGNWLRDALGNFQEAETIGLHLNAVLESNGREVAVLTAQYNDFASSLERITTEEDDHVLSLLATAETYRITGRAAEQAVSDAIGLATITKGNAESLIRLTAAIARGDIETAMMMARMVPQLRNIKDESEFVAEAQKLVAAGMKAAAAETESSAGAMKMLKRDYGNMLEDVGKIVADTLKPVINGVRETIAWFRQLPDSVKTGITVVAMLAVAVLSVAAAITVAGAVFNTAFGGVGLIIGLVVTAGVAIAVWISKLGGVKEAWEVVQKAAGVAWEWVKAKALEFWAWLKPITDAAVAFAITAWGIIKTAAIATWDFIVVAATQAWDFIISVWEGIFGDAKINWEDVQDVIQRVILFAEFTLLNFEEVISLVWVAMKLDASIAADSVRNGFIGIAAAGAATCKTLGRTFTDLWKVIRGEDAGPIRGISEQWREDFESIALSLGGGVSDLTRNLQAEFDQMSEGLFESFEDFVAMRRREFATLAAAAEYPKKSPAAQELEQMKKAVKEAEKFDAVLRGSAEGVARIIAYQERLTAVRPGGAGGSGAPASMGGGIPSPSVASLSGPTPANTSVPTDAGRDRTVALLISIDGHLARLAGRPPVTFSPSNVTE